MLVEVCNELYHAEISIGSKRHATYLDVRKEQKWSIGGGFLLLLLCRKLLLTTADMHLSNHYPHCRS
jgi:hypothetical protein